MRLVVDCHKVIDPHILRFYIFEHKDKMLLSELSRILKHTYPTISDVTGWVDYHDVGLNTWCKVIVEFKNESDKMEFAMRCL